MQTAASARSDTNATLSGLTHLDSLVTAATAQGSSYIAVDSRLITAGMITSLQGLGYDVQKQATDNPDFAPYIIGW